MMNPDASSLKVVIVEDNTSLADIYKTRLEILGYKCVVANDGQQALQVIQHELPNLVLLDLMVPKIAGDQILATMRASDWGKHIKVLIVSNLNEADAPKGLRNMGIEGYAVKANLSNDQLDRLVDRILKPEDQKEDVLLESKEAPAEALPSAAFTGIRVVVYPTTDLAGDTAFWQAVTGLQPYAQQPYYVGFDVPGCELGLDPNAPAQGLTYPVAYWKVTDVAAASSQATAAGASVMSPAQDVGGGVLMARFKDRGGHIFGFIQMPAGS